MVEYYGNLFAVFHYSLDFLDNANEKISWRFTAPASKTADKVSFRIHSIEGTSPTYRIGIQGNSGGEPDGSWLNGDAYADIQPVAAGWAESDITDAGLTQGTVYHIVIEHLSGTIDASNRIRIRTCTDQWHKIRPIDITVDSNYEKLFYNGAVWSAANKDPIFYIEWDDTTSFGQPFDADDLKYVFDDNYYGEKITVPSDKAVSHIQLALVKVGSPVDNLYITIYNVTDSIEELSEVISEEIGSLSLVDHALVFPFIFLSTKVYHLYLESPNSVDASNCYQLSRVRSWTFEAMSWYGTTDRGVYTINGAVPLAEHVDDCYFRFTITELTYDAPTYVNPHWVHGEAKMAIEVG